jgi:excisionase family DNA binding protein
MSSSRTPTNNSSPPIAGIGDNSIPAGVAPLTFETAKPAEKRKSRRWSDEVRERSRHRAKERAETAQVESIASAGERLGVSKNTAYAMVHAGTMPTVPTGKRRRGVPRQWVDRMLAAVTDEAVRARLAAPQPQDEN